MALLAQWVTDVFEVGQLGLQAPRLQPQLATLLLVTLGRRAQTHGLALQLGQRGQLTRRVAERRQLGVFVWAVESQKSQNIARQSSPGELGVFEEKEERRTKKKKKKEERRTKNEIGTFELLL